MDIIEALYIAKHSPSKIAVDIKSFIFGFKDKRDVTYFDLFLFYTLFSYQPANDYFDKGMSLSIDNQVNFFITKINENPEIFANCKVDFYETISLTKEAILYGVNKNYFIVDENLIIKLVKKTVSNKNRTAENIGKLCSTQSTAYLYNYFKVDIDAI